MIQKYDVAFGTWKISNAEMPIVISAALELGFKHIDTAAAYANEVGVGDGILNAGLPRDALFVSGKLWTTKRKYDDVIKACKRSLKNLRLSSFDQYLIHWTAPPALYENWREMNAETWRAMESLKSMGLARNIGVCNFAPHHLSALLQTAETPPYVNQVECHPGFFPINTIEFCLTNGIHVEAWSPLGNGTLLTNPALMAIARNHSRGVAQICLRWCLQHGVTPVTKTASPEHMRSNLDVFDFSLTDKEIAMIDALPRIGYSGLNPDTITQFS